MKIEFKQSFEEEGKEFKIKYKGKAVEAEVPAHFIFLATFFAFLKAGLIKILEIKEDEFKYVDESLVKNLSDEDQEFLQGVLESAVMKDEESEESNEDKGSEDDKEPSTSSDSVDSASQSSTESAPASEQNPPASDEVKKSEEEIQAEKDKAEFDSLHEKAKRLNKNEKARYEELKSKLKIEG